MVLAFIELGCTTAVDTWRHGPSHGSETLRNGNGGRLTVYSVPNVGTTVRLSFPAERVLHSPAGTETAANDGPAGG